MCLILSLCLLTPLFLTPLAGSQVPPPAPPQNRPVALVGGTIHPMTGPVIERGVIVFEKGKIIAIGTDVPIPPDAEVIDVQGQHVYPGLIDANSILGLTEIDSIRATRDFAETGDVNPNVRAEVAINPDSEILPVTRANGVLVALAVPRGGVLAGRSAAIVLDGWTWEDMTLKAPVGLHVYWPRMTPTQAYPYIFLSEEEQRQRGEEAIRKLKEAFREARAYWVAKKAESRHPGVPYHDVDVRWEALIPVFEGKLPVFVHADTLDQIQAAVAWAEAEKVRIVLVGGADAPMAADLLRQKDIPVIAGPILELPTREWEPYDAPFTLPARLAQAGIRYCIAGDGGAWNERNLPYHAAMATAYGLPRDEALKAITLYCARILGIDDRVGSLQVGKDATLFVATGDPLDIRTQVTRAFIQGRPVNLYNRHQRLYEKYQEKYRQRKTR
ncbi:MAG: amidohydrolase family protein [Acidobacteria bacterium]|nr:amidohydrolase family protein [Acidobacteriota bacterium]